MACDVFGARAACSSDLNRRLSSQVLQFANDTDGPVDSNMLFQLLSFDSRRLIITHFVRSAGFTIALADGHSAV